MSRILRHVGNKDFRRTRQRQIGEQKERAAQKLKEWQEAEAERKQIEEAAKPFKSDWRKEFIAEKMTTANMGMINYSAEGEVNLGAAMSNISLSGDGGLSGYNTITRSSTSSYKQFDTMVVTISTTSSDWTISPGGSIQDLGSGGSGSHTVVIPKSYSSLYFSAKDDGSFSASVQYQRRRPVNVVVSLDDPEAIPFIRNGLGGSEERRRQLKDQLDASNEWMDYLELERSKTYPGDIAANQGPSTPVKLDSNGRIVPNTGGGRVKPGSIRLKGKKA